MRRTWSLRYPGYGPGMTLKRRTGAWFLVLALAVGGSTMACGDDAGEDEIGDGEINDEGD